MKDNLINQQELTDRHPRVIAVNDQLASINRAIAVYRHVAGVATDREPPAAP